MNSLVATIGRLVAKDDGQDLVEYGLLAALIAVVVVAGVTGLGSKIYEVFWRGIGNAI